MTTPPDELRPAIEMEKNRKCNYENVFLISTMAAWVYNQSRLGTCARLDQLFASHPVNEPGDSRSFLSREIAIKTAKKATVFYTKRWEVVSELSCLLRGPRKRRWLDAMARSTQHVTDTSAGVITSPVSASSPGLFYTRRQNPQHKKKWNPNCEEKINQDTKGLKDTSAHIGINSKEAGRMVAAERLQRP